MLLNYHKSLCPLFPLYFSNFPLLCTFFKIVHAFFKKLFLLLVSYLLEKILSILGGKNERDVTSYILNQLQILEKIYF